MSGLQPEVCHALANGLSPARCSWGVSSGLEDRGSSKRAWSWRWLWDGRRQRFYQASVLALPVRHPAFPDVPLFLVVARGQEHPWYRLAAEPISTEQQAWEIVFAYMRRWHLEEAFRYSKSELAFESPRLWQWEHRVKLLMLARLSYAFLLSLLILPCEPVRLWLLRYYCHRTGNHCRHAYAPLYRLRSAERPLVAGPSAHLWAQTALGEPAGRDDHHHRDQRARAIACTARGGVSGLTCLHR